MRFNVQKESVYKLQFLSQVSKQCRKIGAFFSYCKKEINIGNMGETALPSLLKRKKQQEISKFSCTTPITSLLKKQSETSNVNGLFAAMLPDSEIAENFQCGSTKASYVLTYGLVSYLHSFSSPHQVVSFNESLNNSVQKEQMDLLIRYWDNGTDKVCTH